MATAAYGPLLVLLAGPFRATVISRLPGHGHAAAIEAWTAAFRADLPADGAPTYVNFMGAEDADSVCGAYPASAYARLRELKRRDDPDNVFRANHSIRPASCPVGSANDLALGELA